ncbi:MAG: amidohydrolase [Planctomycetota bacterium]
MTATLSNDAVRESILAATESATAIRRDLHAHPELGFDETRTSGVIQRELAALGIAFRADMGGEEPGTGTGVTAHLPATVNAAGPCIGLRADIDALPIHEETGRDYASTTAGVMHACGHDGHTANLLGVARVLSAMEHRPNPVTLVFQPAEEGGGGGEKMCRDGCLDGGVQAGVDGDVDLGPSVARMYGLHGWPEMHLGQIATRPGPLLAATDEFDVVVRGEGGHAAFPHKAADPVLCSAHVITALQSIVSRNTGPTDACVVTVATTENPSVAHNVIPPFVRIGGTVRTLRNETRAMARERFYAVVTGTCAAMGCRAEITWHDGYPVTRNDAGEAARVLDVARAIVGNAAVTELDEPFMGGEDFSYYCERVPSCFFVVGLTPDGDDVNAAAKLHQAGFDFNDNALPIGMEMMVRLAMAGVEAGCAMGGEEG